ncbi:MAG: fumarate hydratase, partial [Desulfovibrio sp.]|nr:fumarate hydratase [Desulfovibrio sp.]
MKEIPASAITDAVARLCVQACCHLPEDMRTAFEKTLQIEPSAVGRDILRQLLENADIAARENMPICQDTGLAVIFADVGQDVHISGGDFSEAVNAGVQKGYVEGYLRKS